MGDSIALVRFVGMRISKELADELWHAFEDEDGGFRTLAQVGGVKYFIHSGQFGEEPYWIIRSDAKSLCQLSYCRWDGHGGGAEDFDFHADPFSEAEQKEYNRHDRDRLEEFRAILEVRLDEIESKTGSNPGGLGPTELVFGWTNTWPRQEDWVGNKLVRNPDIPVAWESEEIVSYGPWEFDDDGKSPAGADYYSNLPTRSPDGIIVPPYGVETIEGRGVIPIQGKVQKT